MKVFPVYNLKFTPVEFTVLILHGRKIALKEVCVFHINVELSHIKGQQGAVLFC